LRKGRRGEAETVKETPLPESRLDPLLYIADVVANRKQVDNIMAIDINAAAVEILDAAKQSIATGKPVKLQ
ncbi:MAG: gfo/Idh/MocA family oxidoreductase, partial [Acidobacteria bacterium]|nr:gfo/Idh/MocA family oxidoreductase [Acidobacteriota bacterium]